MLKKLVVCLLSLAAFHVAANDNVPDPHAFVQESTNRLLDRLLEVQPLYKQEPERFYSEIKASLGPFIDFDGFSRRVMAKYYRRANDEQIAQFNEKFQEELIRTYAKALIEFDNQKVEVLPLKTPPEDGRAVVELAVHGKNGAVYPVEYTLNLVEGEWKLLNVKIEGVNIGLQFRSQFANYMQKYRNNIDDVIANWNVNAT